MAKGKGFKDDEEDLDEAPAAPAEEAAPKAPQASSIKAELQEHGVTIKTKDDLSKVQVGMFVSGDGIANGTTVVAVAEGGVVMNQGAIKTGTDVELRIG